MLLALVLLPALVAAYTPVHLPRPPATHLRVPIVRAVATLEPPTTEESVDSGSFADEKPLSGPQRVVRALTFWSKVLPILAAYKAVEVKGGTEAEMEAKYEELHDWGSDRLQGAINELKGFYVKTGQVISTRVDLFPEQYTSKLASLQDDLDAMPAEQIKAIVQRELLLGEPLETIFASFDDKPLGSASIAQVHAATLLDGRRVAVKVQRPKCARPQSAKSSAVVSPARAVLGTHARCKQAATGCGRPPPCRLAARCVPPPVTPLPLPPTARGAAASRSSRATSPT